jgi:hypothetical protein
MMEFNWRRIGGMKIFFASSEKYLQGRFAVGSLMEGDWRCLELWMGMLKNEWKLGEWMETWRINGVDNRFVDFGWVSVSEQFEIIEI